MSELDISNPHDSFFKKTFGRPDLAREYCEAYLPHDVRQQLDLSTINPLPTSYVDEKLRTSQSDLLYEVKLTNGEEAFLYLLFEHKSSPDQWVLLQLLRYMVAIWYDYHENHPSEKLPAVIPLVIYHGEKKWTCSTEFASLIDVPSELINYLPSFSCMLQDLSQYETHEIIGAIGIRIAMTVLKYGVSSELPDKLIYLCDLFAELAKARGEHELIKTAFRYLLGASNRIGFEDICQMSGTIDKEVAKMALSTAQKLMEQGKLEGKAEGMEIEAQETVFELYEARFKRPMSDHLKQVVMGIHNVATLRAASKYLVRETDAMTFEALLLGQIAG